MGYDLEKFFSMIPHKFSETEIITIFYRMVIAIQFIHSCNIIHRDIKPSNILLGPDLTVKICDFGLSRTMPEENREGYIMRRESGKVRHYSCFHERTLSREHRKLF